MLQPKLNPWKTILQSRVYSIMLIALIALTVALPLNASAAETVSAPGDALLDNKPWIGDFDQMAEKRQIRVLVVYSKTFYFLDRGRQRAKAMDVWSEPFVKLRLPKIFNLRSDPFERADTEANGYHNWRIEHLFLLVPAQSHVAEQMGTFADYPPRQKPAKFNVEEVLNNLKKAKSTD